MSGREVGGEEYRTHTLIARLQYDDNFTCGARAGEERRLGVNRGVRCPSLYLTPTVYVAIIYDLRSSL